MFVRINKNYITVFTANFSYPLQCCSIVCSLLYEDIISVQFVLTFQSNMSMQHYECVVLCFVNILQ